MTNQRIVLKKWLLALPVLLLVACSKDNNTTPKPTPQPTPTTATVQVSNGYGSGTTTIGDSVYVWSNPPAAGTVFEKWTGDVSGLKYLNEWKSKVISRNDVTEEPTRLADSYANYKKLAGRGIRAEFYTNEPSPVYPKRFTFVPGVDVATSKQIYNDLKNGGQLDANDFFKTNPRQSETWKTVLSPTIVGNKALVASIEDQLFVCYTEHKFHKDANARTIAFFDKSL